jgi:Tol biopolymer transport system component
MAPDLVECEAHGTPTRLRCAEADCGKPICPQCLVKTAVGLKCEEHAQSIAPRFDRRAQRSIIGAVALVAVAVVILSVAVFNQSSKPTLAPDNTPAPAASGEPGANGRIVPASVYVIGVDGSNARTLTNRALAFDAHPAWSPDGTRIAFMSDRDGNSEVYIMNADGTAQRRLTDLPGQDGYPAWSRDGARIAFVSDRGGAFQLWTMAPDGTAPSRLAEVPAVAERPSYTRDGRIAFTSDRDGNPEIYVMGLDGSDPTRLTNNPSADGEAAVSPDGSLIAFASDRDGGAAVYVMALDGTGLRKLTTGPRGFTPGWSPDGRSITYISDAGAPGN